MKRSFLLQCCTLIFWVITRMIRGLLPIQHIWKSNPPTFREWYDDIDWFDKSVGVTFTFSSIGLVTLFILGV